VRNVATPSMVCSPTADADFTCNELANAMRAALPSIAAFTDVPPDGSFSVLWLTPAAEEMTNQDWSFPDGRFLSYVLAPPEPGQPALFILLNAAADEIVFRLPKLQEYRSWQQVLNTTEIEQAPADFAPGAEASAPPRSVLAFAGSP